MSGGSGRRVAAIMQPYFAAYSGYYRLLAAVDVFVIYDCVQFPRRGWVHRNRLPDAHDKPAWLTLPLEPAPFEARIDSLEFVIGTGALMAERIQAFPSLNPMPQIAAEFLQATPLSGSLVDYLERQLALIASRLSAPPTLLRSSALDVPQTFRGPARIIEICRRIGATDYVNASGGVDLYNIADFAAQDMALHFLPVWEGSTFSLLHRLATEPIKTIMADIQRQTPNYRGR